MTFSITHSPDADDRFMFWALKTGRVAAPEPITFDEADTQRLNELALDGKGDILAISAACYPLVSASYQPLKMGCSIGDGYGPVIVAKQQCTLADLRGKCIAVPGLHTTAYAVLCALLADFEARVVPIVPMRQIFDVLDRHEVDAALIIHEGRLLYPDFDTVKICDLGEWWQAETGTPLPLGMNVIRRSIPEATRRSWAALLTSSCEQGLAEREVFVREYLQDTPMPEGTLHEYLDMYANDSTLRPSDRDRAGFQALYERLQTLGMIAHLPPMDWL